MRLILDIDKSLTYTERQALLETVEAQTGGAICFMSVIEESNAGQFYENTAEKDYELFRALNKAILDSEDIDCDIVRYDNKAVAFNFLWAIKTGEVSE